MCKSLIGTTSHLQLSEAKLTLVQHPQMLQELTEWEERMRSKELLVSGSPLLIGYHVSFCNVQQSGSWISGVITAHNPQTKVGITAVFILQTWVCKHGHFVAKFCNAHLQ